MPCSSNICIGICEFTWEHRPIEAYQENVFWVNTSIFRVFMRYYCIHVQNSEEKHAYKVYNISRKSKDTPQRRNNVNNALIRPYFLWRAAFGGGTGTLKLSMNTVSSMTPYSQSLDPKSTFSLHWESLQNASWSFKVAKTSVQWDSWAQRTP